MKARNLARYLEEYKKLERGGRGLIWTSDIEQCRLSAMKNGQVDIFDAICNALEMGVIIGLRLGKRESKAGRMKKQ